MITVKEIILNRKDTIVREYTKILNTHAETLSLEDDDYEESLFEIASLFRGLDKALTVFVEEHGYIGRLEDVPAKAKFLQEKFKLANIAPPRDFKEWFVPNKKLARETSFKICFAFGLNIEETNDFFRRIQFERGFDCHSINEVVYYFCMKNGLSYTEAQEIIECIPVSKKAKTIPNREVLYTETIIEYINSIDDKEKLIEYIKENISDFQYNNATAIKSIQELWNEISKADGLAVQEGLIIDRTQNRFEDKRKKSVNDTRSTEVIVAEIRQQEQEVKPDDFVIAGTNASTWIIFSQIIGLDNYQENEYAMKHDRSLKSVLSENKLMPLKADYCFPNRQNIDKLIRGDLVGDDEIIRKMLIFLVFYNYWAKLIISKNEALYQAEPLDAERCLCTINARLMEAGYPELYAGNPYDWMFMWALKDENPLEAFRYYMREVFDIKEKDTED